MSCQIDYPAQMLHVMLLHFVLMDVSIPNENNYDCVNFVLSEGLYMGAVSGRYMNVIQPQIYLVLWQR